MRLKGCARSNCLINAMAAGSAKAQQTPDLALPNPPVMAQPRSGPAEPSAKNEIAPRDNQYPHHYRIGLSFLNASRNDALLNTDYQPYYLNGGSRLQHRGEVALCATADQRVWHSRDGARRLGLFGSIYYNFGQGESVQYAVKGGAVLFGLLSSRPADSLGLGLSANSLSARETLFLDAMQQVAGGSGNVARSSYTIEANYGIQLRPGLTLRPNIQYLVDPDPRYTPRKPNDIPNALVLGLQLMSLSG
jgi:porin